MKYNKYFIFLIFSTTLWSVYRPLDIYRAGARAVGAGGTGTSNIDSMGSLSQNPAYLADITSTRFAFAADAQTRITTVQADVNLNPQFLPVVAIGTPVADNFGVGFMFYSNFQRHFLDENFLYYNFETVTAWQATRNLSVSAIIGAGLGLQATRFEGWGFSYGASALYHTPGFDAGILIKPGTVIDYPVFSTGRPVTERLPDLVKAGISKQYGGVRLTFEVEYLNWDGSYFLENGVDITPSFQQNYLGRLNPHIGAEFSLPWFPGLAFRTGILTEDFMDFEGINDKQVLLTFGIGGLAANSFWGDKLKIDFSLIDSFIPSIFFKESHNIEKMQVTFEFIY